MSPPNNQGTTVKDALKTESPNLVNRKGQTINSEAISKRSDDYDDEYDYESDESEADKQLEPADNTVGQAQKIS